MYKHTKDGTHTVDTVSIDDNLIIKGDNQIVLENLLSVYKGKIKLIYVDPPYNTGNTRFKYNDKMKSTTWLSFMQSRLITARKLLKDDGVIFVSIDDNEQAYLKVLMDEVFGRDNFVVSIAVKSSTASGLKTTHRNKTIIKQKDIIHVYAKYSKSLIIKPQYYKSKEWDTHYNWFLNKETLELYNLKDTLKERGILSMDINNKAFKEFYIKHADCIFRGGKSMPEDIRKTSLLPANKDRVVPYGDNQYAYNGNRLAPFTACLNYVYTKDKHTLEISKLVTDFWEDIDFNNTQNEGGVSFPAGKKPEGLITRIIDMSTEPNDIVLDFFLGSGTTAAVAHKMGRKYIGIEQMDYIDTIAVERLKKVIDGEQGGISKAVGWQGGGSFVRLDIDDINIIKQNV